MTGRHKFSELESSMAPERRARIDRMAEELGEEMDLAQLRTGRRRPHPALGEILDIEQPFVAKPFAEFIQRERDRLRRAREEFLNQRQELENLLAAINRELAAIDAYEGAKSGNRRVPVRRVRQTRTPSQGRRAIKREALLELIQQHPGGLTRGEILEKLGLKGNKSGEQSISNALNALTKSNKVSPRDRKYVSA